MAPSKHAFDWHSYENWNRLIVDEFYSGSHGQQPVYLDLEEDTLIRLGTEFGLEAPDEAASDLEATVAATLHRVEGEEGVFTRHIERLEEWRKEDRPDDPPPFVALLSFLSLVAQRMQSDENFHLNNFYGRLAKALGERWEDRKIRKKLGDDFRQHTPQIWNSLRAWLVRHEGQLGLPTAEAFDRRKYIGLPMSQTLVRTADRQKLPEFFAHYHLRPGQSIAVEDMRLLMEQWLVASGFSPALKRLFSKHGQQIALVAALELESWDGVLESDRATGGRERHARLVLSARLRLTTRQVIFELVVQGSRGLPGGRYRLQNDDAAAARAAFEDTDFEVSLPNSEQRSWLTIPESPRVSYPDFLFSSVRFQHSIESVTIERNPSQFVALERDEERRSFIEVSNITLGSDLLLLAHSSLGEQVAEIAKLYARPGWKLLRPEDARGLPGEWWLFHSIQFLVVPGFDQDQLHQLAPLIPVSRSQVAFGGGFSLAGRARWHVRFPPELRLSTSKSCEARATLSDLADTVHKGVESETLLQTFEGACVLQLSSAGLPEGDFRVSLASANTTLATASIGLRSANHPRHVPSEMTGWFGHSPGNDGAAFALKATERSSKPDSDPWICGLDVGNVIVTTAGEEVSLSEGQWPQTIEDDREHMAQLVERMPEPRSGELPSCLITNAHLFVHPPFDKRIPAAQRPPRVGNCRYCGYTKFFPKHRKTSDAGDEVPRPERMNHNAAPVKDLDAVVATEKPDGNALLDALSFQGLGTYQNFAERASQVCDDPWYPLETASLFSALGHVDIERDESSLRPTRWRIVPTTFHLVTSRGTLTLVGFRSSRLLGRVLEDCDALGLAISVDRCEMAPDRVQIEDCGPVEAELLCESASRELPMNGRLVEDADIRIAELCPKLTDLLEALPIQGFPNGWRLERYEVSTNRWISTHEARCGHAYLAQSGGRRLFGFLTEQDLVDGTMRVADYRTVKYLAAAAASYRLLSYDKTTQVLSARLGSPLPGLYERAAVSCSGLPPTVSRGRTCYTTVSEPVARHLIEKLCTMKGEFIAPP